MFCIELAEHETAIICDFKKFYHVRAIKAGQSYSMDEALAYLKGLSFEMGSLYYASKNNLDYPMEHIALILADIFDLHVAINSDPKKPNNYRYPRPFEILPQGTERKAGTVVPMKQAESLYHMPVQTKTDEEILELNRQKRLAKKEAKDSEQSSTA